MSDRRQDRRRFVSGAAAAAGALATGAFATHGLAQSEKWGELVGRFVYDGEAPERKKLVVNKDVDCCGKYDIRDESLMVDPKGGLGNVFVYVRTEDVTVNSDLAKSASEKVVLDNRDCIFKPHCLTVWYTQQIFETINSDPIGQNVAFSPLFDTPVNVVLPIGGKATHRFGRSQRRPVKVLCNYHPWESAYILPRSDPYMAISKPDGTFRIAGLPPGELEFQVWQERVGYFQLPQWRRGRFTMEIKAGVNDLGTIKCAPSLFSS